VGAARAEREGCSAAQLLLPALGALTPVAQAIIVNDKVTIEVIIVKLMLIIWIFYFIFGCSGNVSP